MSVPVIPVSEQEVILLRELLQQHLPELHKTMYDESASPQEVIKAKLSRESIKRYLEAEPDENHCLMLQPKLLEALIYSIRVALCRRAAAMVTMLQDESLEQDVLIKVATDAILVKGIIDTFSDPSLPSTLTSGKGEDKPVSL